MAKTKNKKKLSADHIHMKKTNQNKKVLNPFEVHINKEKLKVLGKKQKNDIGLPGVSRAKALMKRKRTLLQEYKLQNKSNKFMDKRIGERNPIMTEDDKVMARFTAVRVKTHTRKSIFNLADDEVLTHKGQTLNEIEKFDDPRSDDEESLDENQSGKLDSNFVENVHFGGGMLKKTGKEGALSHKQIIEQLIEESKKRKAEKQKTKEATLELTEKLDTEWKDLLPLINKKTKEQEQEHNKIDDYDKVMRELRFEARGTVSDRLKTEDEIAKEEKEKLEQMEKERLERMQGVYDKKPSSKPNHRSADDLDDDFVFDSDPEYMLSYNNDGEANVDINAEINGRNVTDKETTEDNAPNDRNESDDEEDDDDDDEGEESESEDNLSDLKEASSDSEIEETTNETTSPEKKVGSSYTTDSVSNKTAEKNVKEEEDEISKNKEILDNNRSQILKEELQERKLIMEKARKELPYTFSLPTSYEDLQKIFENQSSDHQSIILERMIKCNHPSLSETNKVGLGVLFAYLLQYINDLFDDNTGDSLKGGFKIFASLTPHIYDLAQLNKENAHNSVIEVIKEKHQDYRKRSKEFPGTELLTFLKLISVLFPTSDFRHQIVTPCYVFMEQMFNKCRVKNKRDVSYGIFLATLFLEYTTLSKRYLPAVINFLGGLLHMAIPKTGVRLVKVLLPFRSVSNTLVLTNDHSKKEVPLKMNAIDLLDSEIDDEYKIRVFYNVLKMVRELKENYRSLPSCPEIFGNILLYLDLIHIENYPQNVQKEYHEIKNELEQLRKNRELEYIVMEAKKPKALRLYEPKIVEVFDGKRRKVQSREKSERDKLMHKLKKETKGALREIRRDKSFLGRVKINHKIQSDKERREKVKRIYAEASIQQSELNSIDRKKKRKK